MGLLLGPPEATFSGVEAKTSPVRGLGYLAGSVLALDLVLSGVVLTVLRGTWRYWLFAATLLASVAMLIVVLWAMVVVWQLSRSAMGDGRFEP